MVEELSDDKIGIKEEIIDRSDFEELEIATDEAVNDSEPSSTQIEVFDSGATTHIVMDSLLLRLFLTDLFMLQTNRHLVLLVRARLSLTYLMVQYA